MTMKSSLCDTEVVIIEKNRQELMNGLPWMIQLNFENTSLSEKVSFLVLLAYFGQISEKQGGLQKHLCFPNRRISLSFQSELHTFI